jgi:hypothetical protein
MPCYIPREYMYLDILHVFYSIPNESKIHFGIHMRYISRYKMYRARGTYMRDTCGIHMRYMYLQRFEDTWRIHAGYMRDT